MIRRLSLLLSLCIFSVNSYAAHSTLNLFVQALKNGQATMPVSNDPPFDVWVNQIKTQTRDTSEIIIHAYRFKKFTQQPTCGRVGYELEQPASHTRFPEIGGQLNICENAQPPMMFCANQIRQLIPASNFCDDGSKPVNTQEVDQAIKDAIAGGSLSIEQTTNKLKQIPNQKGGLK